MHSQLRRFLMSFAVAALAVTIAGCGSSAGTKRGEISIVASTNVYGDIARQIAGDGIEVTSIIDDSAQDPHSFEANPRIQRALKDATIIVRNGGGYDDFVDKLLGSDAKNHVVINAVDVSGKQAPKDGELNEHVWYDLPSMRKVADAIADALAKEAPDRAASFSANATAFTSALDQLSSREASMRGQYKGTPVAITEPVPLYMLDAVGLINQTPEEFSEAIEEETDVPARVLADTLKLFTGKAVKVLVYNSQTESKQTEQVLSAAKSNGIPVVPVAEVLPSDTTYQAWIGATLDQLAKALAS